MDFAKQLDKCSEFECIFGLVKEAVESTTGRRRAGLILGLCNLPNHIGAMHQMGSNFIIVNKRLLEHVVRSSDKKLINAYVFHVLLHEYMHSLGCANEQETEILVHAISEEVLGPKHTATLIARYGLGAVFSRLGSIEGNIMNNDQNSNGGIEIVRDIESENLNYFG